MLLLFAQNELLKLFQCDRHIREVFFVSSDQQDRADKVDPADLAVVRQVPELPFLVADDHHVFCDGDRLDVSADCLLKRFQRVVYLPDPSDRLKRSLDDCFDFVSHVSPYPSMI